MTLDNVDFIEINEEPKPFDGDIVLCDAPEYTPLRFIVAEYKDDEKFFVQDDDITEYVEGWLILKAV